MLCNPVVVPPVDECAKLLAHRLAALPEPFIQSARRLPPLEMTPAHLRHAQQLLDAVPEFSDFRRRACPRRVADERLWNVYFTILAAQRSLWLCHARELGRRRSSSSQALSSSPSAAEGPTAVHSPGAAGGGGDDDGGASPHRSPTAALAARVLDVVAPRGTSMADRDGVEVTSKEAEQEDRSTATQPNTAATAAPLARVGEPGDVFSGYEITSLTTAATRFVSSSAQLATRIFDDVSFAFAVLTDDDDEKESFKRARTAGVLQEGNCSGDASPAPRGAAASEIADGGGSSSNACPLPECAFEVCESAGTLCLALVNWWPSTHARHELAACGAPPLPQPRKTLDQRVNDEFESYF